MQGAVVNPSRGVLSLASQRLSVGYLDVHGGLRISFPAATFKPPANGKAKLDGRDIVIDEVKSETPFAPHRTWTLIARFAETEG
jgi:hypothetical protein